MAKYRPAWSLRQPAGPGTVFLIRYWNPSTSKQVERSLKTKDEAEANKRAAVHYAGEVLKWSGAPPATELESTPESIAPVAPKKDALAIPFATVRDKWLESLKGRVESADSYRLYLKQLGVTWVTLGDITTPSIREAQTRRLAEVGRESVRKAMVALRRFLAWCVEAKYLPEAPAIPELEKRARGTDYKHRRRKSAQETDEYTPQDIEAFLDALPDYSRRGPIKLRFLLQYDLGLRSSVLDRLSIPEHWHSGMPVLILQKRTRKGNKSSVKPLTRRCLDALEAHWDLVKDFKPEKRPGLIFGHRDYRYHVLPAAKKALGEERGKRFAPAFLRSARLTHMIDAGASVTAAQALADHEQVSTTARYVRASRTAVEQAFEREGVLAGKQKTNARPKRPDFKSEGDYRGAMLAWLNTLEGRAAAAQALMEQAEAST